MRGSGEVINGDAGRPSRHLCTTATRQGRCARDCGPFGWPNLFAAVHAESPVLKLTKSNLDDYHWSCTYSITIYGFLIRTVGGMTPRIMLDSTGIVRDTG
jgi:hypothetical protein